MKINIQTFGADTEGKAFSLYTLNNGKGLEASISNLGGTLVSLIVPDKSGTPGNIILGYKTGSEYLHDSYYMGATVGRYANRIANSRFTINGREYALPSNEGGNHLHGGFRSLSKLIWQAQAFENEKDVRLVLTCHSQEGEEGYPGNLLVTETYVLTEHNTLEIYHTAVTDRDTVVNITNHPYFNLKGHGDVLEHELQLHATRYLPIDAELIPTGEIRPTLDTPMDFSAPTRIGARIQEPEQQLKLAGGYDHTWVLSQPAAPFTLAAQVWEKESGRQLNLYTDYPGLQFYSGNFLGANTSNSGPGFCRHAGFCLEPQYFPDSPNKPHFPSTLLQPDDRYSHKIVYEFKCPAA